MGDTAPIPNLKVAERGEEDKFKQKFPGRKPASTDFLRKRLQKGVKYFDSGDYAMAKSGKKSAGAPVIGKAHPTPEVVTQRKISNASKSKLVEGALIQSPDEQGSDEQEAKQSKEES